MSCYSKGGIFRVSWPLPEGNSLRHRKWPSRIVSFPVNSMVIVSIVFCSRLPKDYHDVNKKLRKMTMLIHTKTRKLSTGPYSIANCSSVSEGI